MVSEQISIAALNQQTLKEAKSLIDRISDISKRPAFETNVDAQLLISQLSRELSVKLRNPEDVAHELPYYPMYAFAARVAVELDIFNILSQRQNSISASELSRASEGSTELIVRILRPLSALGFVEETGENQWRANRVTISMSNPTARAAHIHKWGQCNGTMIKMLDYLKKNNYNPPTDPSDGAYQYAFATKKSAFDYWQDHPEIAANFNTFMAGKRASRPSWAEWWPVETEILATQELDQDGFLLVDVGGGRGHDVQIFQRKFPGRGKLAVEDLPAVIADIKDLNEEIIRVKHNFFQPQPVIGARIYFFGMVFHDWDDDRSLEILRQTVPAMRNGYSKLLIDDAVLPTQGCPAVLGALDIAMMAMHAGKERTESQWKGLLAKAGLEMKKFWPYKGEASGVIEAELI